MSPPVNEAKPRKYTSELVDDIVSLAQENESLQYKPLAHVIISNDKISDVWKKHDDQSYDVVISYVDTNQPKQNDTGKLCLLKCTVECL